MASRTTFDPEREITDRIIAAIEAGTPPWRKPWTGASGGVAFPLRVTGERYRGINAALCNLITMTATVVGLSQANSRAADLVRAYGGGRWELLRIVELRDAVPSILSALDRRARPHRQDAVGCPHAARTFRRLP